MAFIFFRFVSLYLVRHIVHLYFLSAWLKSPYKADADVMFLQSYKFNFTLLPLLPLFCFNVLHCIKLMFLFGFLISKIDAFNLV